MAACCAILEAAQPAITFNGASFPTCYGIQFTNHDRHIYAFEHIFDRVCREHQIEHRLTKFILNIGLRRRIAEPDGDRRPA
jgi:hypothetical protein